MLALEGFRSTGAGLECDFVTDFRDVVRGPPGIRRLAPHMHVSPPDFLADLAGCTDSLHRPEPWRLLRSRRVR